MINYCDLKLKSSLADPYLILWKSVSLTLAGTFMRFFNFTRYICFLSIPLITQGNSTLAIQELGPLEDKRDFVIVWHLAMIFAHEKCKYIG